MDQDQIDEICPDKTDQDEADQGNNSQNNSSQEDLVLDETNKRDEKRSNPTNG